MTKRYAVPLAAIEHDCTPRENPNGSLVSYVDYDALAARLAEALRVLGECDEYLSDIPESAVGGDDYAAEIRRAIRSVSGAAS